jgi:hypothetical protein
VPQTPRNFGDRKDWEQRWFLQHTWCDTCGKADLGMKNPHELEEGGHVYVAGSCNVCGSHIQSEVATEDIASQE